MTLEPLPFRLHPTGRDSVDLDGIASVSYKLTGRVRLSDESVTLEWSGARITQQVSLEKVGTRVDQLPLEGLELPFGRIAGAWVLGGWWMPRFELRVRSAEDLEGVPATRGVTLALRIQRHDRVLARAIASAIEARVSDAGEANQE